MVQGRYNPYPPPMPREFKLGDVDDAYIDDLHLRLFHVLEHNIAALETAGRGDPYVEIGKKLDIMEKMLKVRRLMHQPRRAKKKKRR